MSRMQADATAKQKNIKSFFIYFGGQDYVGYYYVYVVTHVIFEICQDPHSESCRETKRANNLATHFSRSWQIHFSHLTFKTFHRLLFISQLTWRIFMGLGHSFFQQVCLYINATAGFLMELATKKIISG